MVVNYLRGCGSKCTAVYLIFVISVLCKNNLLIAFLLFLVTLSQHLINSVPIAVLTSTRVLMHKQ